MREIVLSLCLIFCTSPAYADSLIPESERRNTEQTYLTYPEWFLVHSPAEYAELTKDHPAHDFPFIGHVGQLWSSYSAVTKKQVESDYPANAGYHAMIMVIASSTTLEYGIRSLYENTVGRTSYILSSKRMSEEEIIGAEIAQQYVDFIRREPWYLFDFQSSLKRLWSETSVFGSQPLRKLERRYALTTEYVVKAIYAKLIELATRAAYEEAKMTTWVVVSEFDAHSQLPAEVKLEKDLGDGKAMLVLPRYEGFWHAAQLLAKQGVNFVDIAGNDSNILVSSWCPVGSDVDESFSLLFRQALISHPHLERRALEVPVKKLSAYLRTNTQIEHVYDY
ncbi:MAG: hypothetical protein HOP24_07010 [Sideroxydans sp.]|nr:hypothetical protein [Sideroxydans sp.]